MSKIFKLQTALKIRLTANINITSALSVKIEYVKPSGTTGSLNALVESAATGIIYFDVLKNSDLINEIGIWKFWAYIQFSDERIARGETVFVKIYDNLT
jgi:hypothetical protein